MADGRHKTWQDIFTLPSGHAMGQEHPNFELRSSSLATAIQSTGHLKCFMMFHIITTMTPGMEGARCLQLCGHTDIGRQIGGIDLVLTANRSLPANVTIANCYAKKMTKLYKLPTPRSQRNVHWCLNGPAMV